MGRDVNRHSGADEETLVCPDDGCCGIVSVLNVVDGCECMYVQYMYIYLYNIDYIQHIQP